MYTSLHVHIKEKLLYDYGMYISLRVHLKKSYYKVIECTYHCVYIARKVGMDISLLLNLKES